MNARTSNNGVFNETNKLNRNSVSFMYTSNDCLNCIAVIHSADYILFQSFEIRGYILTNQKMFIGLNFCSRSSLLNHLGPY